MQLSGTPAHRDARHARVRRRARAVLGSRRAAQGVKLPPSSCRRRSPTRSPTPRTRPHRSTAFIIARALAARQRRAAACRCRRRAGATLPLTSDEDDPPSAIKRRQKATGAESAAAWTATRARFAAWIAREVEAQRAEHADDLDSGLRDASRSGDGGGAARRAGAQRVRSRAHARGEHPAAPAEALQHPRRRQAIASCARRWQNAHSSAAARRASAERSMSDVVEQFFALTPERILDAVEFGGRRATGYALALNSLENRVYEVELEDESRIVAKFYRPGRWSQRGDPRRARASSPSCTTAEVPGRCRRSRCDGGGRDARRARPVDGGVDLLRRVRQGARPRRPRSSTTISCAQLGRLIARLHTVGAAHAAPARLRLDPESYGARSLRVLLGADAIRRARPARAARALRRRRPQASSTPARAPGPQRGDIRLHGDCHLGNLLLGRRGPLLPRLRRLLPRAAGAGPAGCSRPAATTTRDRQRALLVERLRARCATSIALAAPRRAAARAAHLALRGVDRAALARSGVPARLSRLGRSSAAGSASSASSSSSARASKRRWASRRRSGERPAQPRGGARDVDEPRARGAIREHRRRRAMASQSPSSTPRPWRARSSIDAQSSTPSTRHAARQLLGLLAGARAASRRRAGRRARAATGSTRAAQSSRASTGRRRWRSVMARRSGRSVSVAATNAAAATSSVTSRRTSADASAACAQRGAGRIGAQLPAAASSAMRRRRSRSAARRSSSATAASVAIGGVGGVGSTCAIAGGARRRRRRAGARSSRSSSAAAARRRPARARSIGAGALVASSRRRSRRGDEVEAAIARRAVDADARRRRCTPCATSRYSRTRTRGASPDDRGQTGHAAARADADAVGELGQRRRRASRPATGAARPTRSTRGSAPPPRAHQPARAALRPAGSRNGAARAGHDAPRCRRCARSPRRRRSAVAQEREEGRPRRRRAARTRARPSSPPRRRRRGDRRREHPGHRREPERRRRGALAERADSRTAPRGRAPATACAGAPTDGEHRREHRRRHGRRSAAANQPRRLRSASPCPSAVPASAPAAQRRRTSSAIAARRRIHGEPDDERDPIDGEERRAPADRDRERDASCASTSPPARRARRAAAPRTSPRGAARRSTDRADRTARRRDASARARAARDGAAPSRFRRAPDGIRQRRPRAAQRPAPPDRSTRTRAPGST